jgi:3-dehydroquinate synthase
MVKEIISPCKIALVTDDTVNALYASVVEKSLESAGFKVVKFVFSHGEENKNLGVYGQILNFLAENQLTRTDALVALGGGVVGDMAGFAAATFLRGIKYIQMPTTLLSQIDSSVGGKTAIDLPMGKNLVGAFCQPSLVLCDIDTLNTLPKKIFVDGMGEVVKYAVLDKDIFALVESGAYSIEKLVYMCVDYKRRIVEADEFEGGVRKLLNLGHTPAHGIEKLSNYTIPHGNAVAMGVEIINRNSLRHGYLNEKEYKRISAVVQSLVGSEDCPFSIDKVMDAALSDKSVAVII